MAKQKRKVEWEFDFDDIGSRVSEFFSDAFGQDATIETAELAEPLDGAASAVVKVDFSVGRANITALASESENLFEAQITYVGEYEFAISGTTERKIVLRQKGSFPRNFGGVMSNARDLVWNIALHPSVPHNLRLKGGVGETDIDLSQLTVEKIKLDTGVGKVNLTLPNQAMTIDASINGGVGKTDIVIPAGLSGDIDINGGVGAVDVLVSPDTAIRVEADSGLGGIDLPQSFTRVSGNGHFIGVKGVWQSPNFNDSDKHIVIDYNGGVGSFHLKHFQVV